MTTGQLIFYSGVGLLALTIVLAIIFVIKKPVYKPDNVVYNAADGSTQKLRNGYPTDPLTIRRDTGAAAVSGTDVCDKETERITAEQTEKISDTALSQETESVDEQLTEKLPEAADPSSGPTELL